MSKRLAVTIEDLRTIEPRTSTQGSFWKNWKEYDVHVLSGYAGTGKSFISVYKALEDILGVNRKFKQLIIIRSAVPTRNIGALPGDLEIKGSVYEAPYYEICADLFRRADSYERLKAQGKIHFCLTSYIRGITFDNSIILVDEMQNMNYHELYSVMTRVGENSKIVFCGDFRQADTKDTGIDKFLKVLERMRNTKSVMYSFFIGDILRSQIVKDFIIADEELKSIKESKK